MTTADLPARFAKFILVHEPTGCWVWTGRCNASGHGQYKVGGKVVYAHRYAYEQLVGSVPEGLVLRHRCPSAQCCNPDHLTPGTQAENVQDRVIARRSACGERNGRAKLTAAQVAEIIATYQRGRIGYGTLARQYGVSERAISYIVNGQHWQSSTPERTTGQIVGVVR